MERAENSNFFGNILKGVLISVIFTLICLTILALLLVNTNISENTIQPAIIGITATSIMFGSFLANRKMKKNGILNGCLVGFLYITIIYVISSIANKMNFSLNTGLIIMVTLGILGGAIGGIIGVNINK